MALINCPECGKEISDSAPQCIHCGYVLKQVGEPKKEKKPLDKKIIIVGIAVAVVAIAVIVLLVIKNSVIPGKNYKLAEQALLSEDYDGAAAQFAALKDYKDSSDRVLECYYEKGKSLVAKQSYSAAIKAFEEAGNYRDAASQIDKAEQKIAEQEAEAARQVTIDNLKKAADLCTASGSSLSSDGLSLKIDAKNKNDTAALLDVLSVIEALDFPDSLLDDMGNTTAMMGKQSQICGDYEVSWTYHPDDGLDVLIKILQ